MNTRFTVYRMTIVPFALALALLVTGPGRLLAQTPSKSSSPTSKLHLPHIPNPLDTIISGVKKASDTVGSLFLGKKQEKTVSRYYPPQGSKKTPEKKGLFDWLKPTSEPKKSETVYDWIGKEPLLP